MWGFDLSSFLYYNSSQIFLWQVYDFVLPYSPYCCPSTPHILYMATSLFVSPTSVVNSLVYRRSIFLKILSNFWIMNYSGTQKVYIIICWTSISPPPSFKKCSSTVGLSTISFYFFPSPLIVNLMVILMHIFILLPSISASIKKYIISYIDHLWNFHFLFVCVFIVALRFPLLF